MQFDLVSVSCGALVVTRAWLRHPQQPSYGVLLELEILGFPQSVKRMADCREGHASLAEIVCPARDRLGAQIFTGVAARQAIGILTLQEDVLRIFVVGNKMLFIVHPEVLHIARDRMLLVHHRHLERT